MIVVITSCAPNFAFRAPGIPPTIPPPVAAASMKTGRTASHGSPAGRIKPINAAQNPPAASWLSAPTLKSPARKPIDTAKPVKVSVVVLYNTWPKPYALPHVPSSNSR